MLASCLDSKHPLCKAEKASLDEALLGVWIKQDRTTTEYVHVDLAGPMFPSGLMRVITCRHEENKDLHPPSKLFIFTADINGEHYLNIAAIKEENLAQIEKKGWNAELIEGYWLAKYQIQDGTLLIWLLNPDLKRELIIAGKIAGRVDKEASKGLITAPTEELVKLFAVQEAFFRFGRAVTFSYFPARPLPSRLFARLSSARSLACSTRQRCRSWPK